MSETSKAKRVVFEVAMRLGRAESDAGADPSLANRHCVTILKKELKAKLGAMDPSIRPSDSIVSDFIEQGKAQFERVGPT